MCENVAHHSSTTENLCVLSTGCVMLTRASSSHSSSSAQGLHKSPIACGVTFRGVALLGAPEIRHIPRRVDALQVLAS